jgi:hypothetical protein
VSLFRRKSRKGGEADPGADAAQSAAVDAQDDVDEPSHDVANGLDDAAAAEHDDWPRSELSDRSAGPFDVSEVSGEDVGYVDLGALRLKGRDGMELRLEMDEPTGRVTSVTAQLAGSAVQLQVFAAPRTSGVWDEIRGEIAAGITRQGGTADEVPGSFGHELLARIPVKRPDGTPARQVVRFTGVDGPRWFLRAVFHGAAAFQPESAGPLEGVVRDVVVVRGGEAMAPRELLPLRLPGTAAHPPVDAGEAQAPLEPFRRGPEITEIH